MEQKEINALIRLLDDPDEEIYSHVKDKFISLGESIVPLLENVWESGDPFNDVVQTRIENIIQKIQFSKVKEELKTWANTENNKILDGAIIIAKYQYPDLDTSKIEKKINQMMQDIWLEINDNLTAVEKVKVINHIFYEIHRFGPNTTNIHSPQNSFINHVIETKKGNPLSLSIIYMSIAQKLGLPIYGVNLPQHFVMAFVDEFADIAKKNKVNIEELLNDKDYSSVLFYINPLTRGAVFPKRDIEIFLNHLKIPHDKKFFEPSSNNEMAIRIINNLIFSYEKAAFPGKKEDLLELKSVIENVNGIIS